MWSRTNEFILPLAIIGCLLIFLVPLPGVVMDCLLVANIALGLFVLLTTLFVRTPLEFNVFPTILLATTLARLVLNVATTRLILTKADRVGMSAAGEVVRQFGQFVSGDRLLVGIIIFAIIFIIQMLVITKGATRISEVAARFALDGVPGRQLAIDADLSSQAIDQAEAKRRRAEVNRAADFYGAMDGASKFIRGDAVAGVVITGINIVGGLFVGVVQGSMGIGEAAEVYTKLTIGDGLASQIPALLISLAAGLLVTRGSEQANLPSEVLRQLFSRPEVLGVAGGFLVLLVFTQLPTLPLLLLAGACFAAIYFQDPVTQRVTPATAAASSQAARPARPRPKSAASQKPASQPQRVEDFLHVDPVELELGRNLVRFASAARNGDLLDRINRLRESVAADLGIVLPSVRIRDNLSLSENQYRIRLMGNLVAESSIPIDGQIIIPPTGMKSRQLPSAQEVSHPALPDRAKWITLDHVGEAKALGCQLVSTSQLIVSHLRTTTYSLAHEMLTRDATAQLLDELRKSSPTIVEELIPNVMRLGQVQQVLQGLLREGVPIRQLATIVEALCDYRPQFDNLAELTEQVRQRLSRMISDRYADPGGHVHVVTLDPQLEETLLIAKQQNAVLESADRTTIQTTLGEALRRLKHDHRIPIVLTQKAIRTLVLELAQAAEPSAVVLAASELAPRTQVRSVEIVTLKNQTSW